MVGRDRLAPRIERAARRSYRHWWPRYVILRRRRRCNLRRCRVFRWLLLREFTSAALLPVLLLDVDRSRGQSAGHSLWLGRHRRLWLGLVRKWNLWCNRGSLGLTAVQPRKIIGTARRGGYCLAVRQNFRGNRVVLDRAAAGSPKQAVRVFVLVLRRPGQRDHGPHQRPLGRL